MGCETLTGNQYSEDPVIAQTQKWADACQQIGQSVITATRLRQAGLLSPGEEEVMGRVVNIYRPICTGDPGPLDKIISDQVVKEAVGELCPELVTSTIEDIAVTVSQAVSCAVREALLLQLEAPE